MAAKSGLVGRGSTVQGRWLSHMLSVTEDMGLALWVRQTKGPH